MSKLPLLKQLVKQRIDAAVEDICGLFETTVVDYEDQLSHLKEENRKYKLLDAVFNPTDHLHRSNVQQILVTEEEVFLARSPELVQDQQPEPLHINTEQEEFWTSQERDRVNSLEEADITRFTFTDVKKNDSDVDKPQSSERQQSPTEDNTETQTPTSSSAKQIKTGTDGETCAEPTRNLDTDNVQQILVTEEEVFLARSPELVQDQQSGPLHIKEEQKASSLEEADITRFTFTDVSLKNDVEKPQSSERQQSLTEDNRETETPTSSSAKQIKTGTDRETCAEPTRNLDTNSLLHPNEKDSDSSETEGRNEDNDHYDDWQKPLSDSETEAEDNDNGWKETREPESGVNILKYKEATVRDVGCNDDKKSFNCSECHKQFRYNWHLQRHMIVHTGEKPFGCSVCGKKFNDSSNRNRHINSVHTEKELFGCGVCGKMFTYETSLRNHMRVHTGEKPFGCSVCAKTFTCKKSLTDHMRVHIGEKPFDCGVCGKMFSYTTSLTDHMRVHTGEKPFGCSVCGKKFNVRSNRNRHINRVHTEEKLFGCDVCGKTFTCKNTLTDHMRVHRGEKPLDSGVCGKEKRRL